MTSLFTPTPTSQKRNPCILLRKLNRTSASHILRSHRICIELTHEVINSLGGGGGGKTTIYGYKNFIYDGCTALDLLSPIKHSAAYLSSLLIYSALWALFRSVSLYICSSKDSSDSSQLSQLTKSTLYLSNSKFVHLNSS